MATEPKEIKSKGISRLDLDTLSVLTHLLATGSAKLETSTIRLIDKKVVNILNKIN